MILRILHGKRHNLFQPIFGKSLLVQRWLQLVLRSFIIIKIYNFYFPHLLHAFRHSLLLFLLHFLHRKYAFWLTQPLQALLFLLLVVLWTFDLDVTHFPLTFFFWPFLQILAPTMTCLNPKSRLETFWHEEFFSSKRNFTYSSRLHSGTGKQIPSIFVWFNSHSFLMHSVDNTSLWSWKTCPFSHGPFRNSWKHSSVSFSLKYGKNPSRHAHSPTKQMKYNTII